MACHSRKLVGVEIADVLILEAYASASFREMRNGPTGFMGVKINILIRKWIISPVRLVFWRI